MPDILSVNQKITVRLRHRTGLTCCIVTLESPGIRYQSREHCAADHKTQTPFSPADNNSLAFNKLLMCICLCAWKRLLVVYLSLVNRCLNCVECNAASLRHFKLVYTKKVIYH